MNTKHSWMLFFSKKKGFESSVGIAADVGFPQEMVSGAAKEALERIQRGENS